MGKIYVCTEESILLDLVYEGMAEKDAGVKVEEITKELEDFTKVYCIEGTYIMGGLTAFLLEQKHGIKCDEEELV